ncbi:MAG: hypothetical protein C4531_13865 [Desulfurivibrio sp.]|jgi:hypothetical protein|nr:MAG: hypothetical protein C4531_13865 [Desulfurivibrio sp.]
MSRIRRHFLTMLFFALSFPSLTIPHCRCALAEEARLTVEEAVWTSVINDLDHGAAYDQTAPVGPLYLWMKVKGSNWALQRLQEAGKLPIYHQWFRHSIIGVSAEGVTTMIDNIMIPAGDPALAGQLETEISSRGFFDWRTWSMKDHIRQGKWVVKVVYADGTPVLCEGNKACEYAISVR